jgi:hypothetical protein
MGGHMTHSTYWERSEMHTNFSEKKTNGKRPSGYRHLNGYMILKQILNKWSGSIWLRTGFSGSEHGNEPFICIKGGEFLDLLSSY